MQIAMSLRQLSLGVATASFLLAGSAAAQTSPMNRSESQQWQLHGVNARLDHSLGAQSAQVGERVEAKLDRTLQTAEGAKLPAGTEVRGKVVKVQASQNGGPSSITLRFATAQLKNGQNVPVKVTVIGAFPVNALNSSVNSMGGDLPPAPKHISSQGKFMQEPGMLHHIELRSAVQGRNSGTFIDRDGNVKLRRGTYLQLAIAARSSNSGQQSGM